MLTEKDRLQPSGLRLLKRILCVAAAVSAAAVMLYIELIYSFPSEITMYCGQQHKSTLGAGVTIGNFSPDMCKAEVETLVPLKEGEYSARLMIGRSIPYKTVKINVTAPESVYASGELVGLRMYNRGLIVVETAQVPSENGAVSPAGSAGICASDVILEINGQEPESTNDVSELIKEEKNTLKILCNEKQKEVEVTPVKDPETGKLRLGLWVRDSTAGVGTLTYYQAENLSYGALGHSISDSDTGRMFSVRKGSIEKSNVMSVKKGERGTPGEIYGSFGIDGMCGTIEKNCESGIFGKITNPEQITGTKLPIGLINQVKEGDASIISTVDEITDTYKIKILRVMPFGMATKGMLIEITDERLLEKTGGIVQGMSGSPIIQNGRIVGAVTHVFVNDPTRGYGIFIENMLAEAEKIK